jgi:hypothetical protein
MSHKITTLFLLALLALGRTIMAMEPEKPSFFRAPTPSFKLEESLRARESLSEEQRKFKAFNIDNPEQFLKNLRSQLRENPLQYLADLQVITSMLLLQNTVMQLASDYLYLTDYVNALTAEEEKYPALLGAQLIGEEKKGRVPY